jgi:hypothetical protein
MLSLNGQGLIPKPVETSEDNQVAILYKQITYQPSVGLHKTAISQHSYRSYYCNTYYNLKYIFGKTLRDKDVL